MVEDHVLPLETQSLVEAHPGACEPGELMDWWAWEQENPRLFDEMYNFWVEKPE